MHEAGLHIGAEMFETFKEHPVDTGTKQWDDH